MKEDKDQFEIEEEESFTKKKSSKGKRNKAPLAYRIVAWISLVVICFGLGYYGTSFVLDIISDGDASVTENVVSDQQELEKVLNNEKTQDDSELSVTRDTFNIYIPSGKAMSKMSFKVNPAMIMEDRIGKVLSTISMEAENNGFLSSGFSVLHIFRTGEILYIDLNSSFISSLTDIGKRNASILMTSIVRSMVENFNPVNKVRILIQGEQPPSNLPIDLSVPWQLAPSA